jgi:hypothetical protein
MTVDLSSWPPVPEEHYELVETLVLSGQLPEARLQELLSGDAAFAAWWQERASRRAKQ